MKNKLLRLKIFFYWSNMRSIWSWTSTIWTIETWESVGIIVVNHFNNVVHRTIDNSREKKGEECCSNQWQKYENCQLKRKRMYSFMFVVIIFLLCSLHPQVDNLMKNRIVHRRTMLKQDHVLTFSLIFQSPSWTISSNRND